MAASNASLSSVVRGLVGRPAFVSVASSSSLLGRPPWEARSVRRRGCSTCSDRSAGKPHANTECAPDGRKPPRFVVTDERIAYQRYQTVYERLVRYPDGRRVSYDVYGTPASDFKSVFVFPYNSRNNTATLLYEYSPGINAMIYGLVAGGFDRKKHASLEHAARAELSEEAALAGGRIISLAPPISQDKYSRNVFHVYMSVDAEHDPSPLSRDAEEYISVLHNVELRRVRELVLSGQMNFYSGLSALIALDAIETRREEMGLRPAR